MEKEGEYPSNKEGIVFIIDYELTSIIGSGNYGSVYKALVKSGKHKTSAVAIKIIDLEKYDDQSIADIKVN